MAENDGRDAEMEALLHVENVDTEAITAQITKGKGKKEATPPADKTPLPPSPGTPPAPPATPPKTEVPTPEAIRTTMLNEMFGEQYKTVDEVKKANIPEALKELTTLRQKNQELSDSLAKKPKHSFASDDIAKFNEFARETGIKDASVFNKINVTDVANMSAMDALVLQHIIENPSLAGQEPQVRRYFERKYDVDPTKIDPKKVESGDLTQAELDQNKLDYDSNLIGVTSDGNKAKTKLQELKGKIKMPDIPAEETPAKKWTPEIETKQKTAWSTVNEKMGETFSTIPIILEEGKEPIVNFVLPEEAKKSILQNALDYVVSNQMEVNETNVKSVANAMYSDILFNNRTKIYHAIFERARSMTEEEILKVYHNPSPKNSDTPPGKGELTSEEAERQKAYDLETGKK